MQTTKMSRAVAGAICAVAATLLAGPTQAALQDRDLNRDSVVDAFYDTDLDITWLRDANVNGAMDWNTAVAWADGYSFGGYDDWRLPSSDGCMGFDCSKSEMGHLWYIELGNSDRALTNTGNFLNLMGDPPYWSGTLFNPITAWCFSAAIGYQTTCGIYAASLLAFAVRPGDVVAVPEPQTYALLLLGLAGLAGRIRQHQR